MMNHPDLFDYCISNPPYQEAVNAGSGSSRLITRDIFPAFQEFATRAATRTAMIYPATWQNNITKGTGSYLIQHGLTQGDKYNSSTIFPSIVKNYPISITHTQRGYSGSILIQGNPSPRDRSVWITSTAAAILYEKTQGMTTLGGAVDCVKLSNTEKAPIPFTTEPDTLTSPVLLYIKKTAGTQSDAGYYYAEKQDILPYLTENYPLDQYRVAVQASNMGRLKHFGEAYSGHSILHRYIFRPGQGHGLTLATLRAFPTMEEAENFARYVGSRVFMELLALDFSKRGFASHVPDLGDYSSRGVINWGAPLEPQLYEFCGLSPEESAAVDATMSNRVRVADPRIHD